MNHLDSMLAADELLAKAGCEAREWSYGTGSQPTVGRLSEAHRRFWVCLWRQTSQARWQCAPEMVKGAHCQRV